MVVVVVVVVVLLLLLLLPLVLRACTRARSTQP